MPITFKNVPANLRVPLFYAEVDNSQANTAQFLQRTLLIGQKTSAGSAPANVPIKVGGVSDARTYAGPNSVLAQMAPHIPAGVHLIPAHPVAGTEKSGPDAGFATLFKGRWCILTPPADASEAAVAALSGFWQRLGAEAATPPDFRELDRWRG